LQWKGLALFELQRAILSRSNARFNAGKMSKSDFVSSLKDITEALKEGEKCLDGEEDGKAGRVAKSTKKMITQVGEIILFSDFI
jgi:hypothetical protein